MAAHRRSLYRTPESWRRKRACAGPGQPRAPAAHLRVVRNSPSSSVRATGDGRAACAASPRSPESHASTQVARISRSGNLGRARGSRFNVVHRRDDRQLYAPVVRTRSIRTSLRPCPFSSDSAPRRLHPSRSVHHSRDLAYRWHSREVWERKSTRSAPVRVCLEMLGSLPDGPGCVRSSATCAPVLVDGDILDELVQDLSSQLHGLGECDWARSRSARSLQSRSSRRKVRD